MKQNKEACHMCDKKNRSKKKIRRKSPFWIFLFVFQYSTQSKENWRNELCLCLYLRMYGHFFFFLGKLIKREKIESKLKIMMKPIQNGINF